MILFLTNLKIILLWDSAHMLLNYEQLLDFLSKNKSLKHHGFAPTDIVGLSFKGKTPGSHIVCSCGNRLGEPIDSLVVHTPHTNYSFKINRK